MALELSIARFAKVSAPYLSENTHPHVYFELTKADDDAADRDFITCNLADHTLGKLLCGDGAVRASGRFACVTVLDVMKTLCDNEFRERANCRKGESRKQTCYEQEARD